MATLFVMSVEDRGEKPSCQYPLWIFDLRV